MRNVFRLLLFLAAIAVAPTVYAQGSPPPNPNYTVFNTKSDSDITAPSTSKIKLFYNGTTLRFRKDDGTYVNVASGATIGTVTSVGLQLPNIFTISNSPVTTTGTLTGTLATQTANTIFAGPTSGGASAPTFRTINTADLGTGTANSSVFLRGDLTWATAGGATLSSTKTPVDATATTFVRVANSTSNSVVTGYITYSVSVIGGTNQQVSEVGKVWFIVANRNGTVTCKLSDDQADGTNGVGMARDATDGSVWTNVFSSAISTTNADIEITSDWDSGTLTSSTALFTYSVFVVSGTTTVTAQ